MGSKIFDAIEGATLDAINKFNDMVIVIVRNQLARNGIGFERLVMRYNPSTMPGDSETVAYIDDTPVLKWKSPVVFREGDKLTYRFVIEYIGDKTPLE